VKIRRKDTASRENLEVADFSLNEKFLISRFFAICNFTEISNKPIAAQLKIKAACGFFSLL
jgi:hypothetical protein